jgi:hypothetical protein
MHVGEVGFLLHNVLPETGLVNGFQSSFVHILDPGELTARSLSHHKKNLYLQNFSQWRFGQARPPMGPEGFQVSHCKGR